MKQVVQNLRSGVLELLDVPCPIVSRGHLLVQSTASLISAGTERSLVEFGKANLVNKARQNPDRVRQVLDKIRTDGLLPTLEAVFNKLDEPLPLGYCNAGRVVEVGPGVTGFAVGDRVASNGPHAEMVHVPVNLCAHIPDQVTDQEASFAILASIGLQGQRLLDPRLGETVTLFGLGLVGLMTVQMLVANGVRVIGIDLDESRLALAEKFGAITIPGADPDHVLRQVDSLTSGVGVDGVLITASAKNDTIVSQSARMCRQRGKIVLVGVANLALDRTEFYKKELTFQVSCSYGPGRYDEQYEQQGIDYPLPFVRWTEQRNIQAVLDLMASRRLLVEPLITSRIAHAEAGHAYEQLAQDRKQLGIVMEYPLGVAPVERNIVMSSVQRAPSVGAKPRVAVIGAGNFTKNVLLPALKKVGADITAIASSGGVSASHAARKFGIARSTSDYRALLGDSTVNTVFITTRHHQHASMVVEALEAGKHVFVEKPLAIDRAGLDAVRMAHQKNPQLHLMVGFNRRFAPHIVTMRRLVQQRTQPLCMTMLVNAGAIPSDHWSHDPRVGGGRIIGEGCHWVDLFRFLAGSPLVDVKSRRMGGDFGARSCDDHMSLTTTFADGSIGTLHYFANGHRSFPKERLTLFVEGKILELDNFRRLDGYGWSNFRRQKTSRQDKGHDAEMELFLRHIATGGAPLIPPQELFETTFAAIVAQESAGEAGPLVVV